MTSLFEIVTFSWFLDSVSLLKHTWNCFMSCRSKLQENLQNRRENRKKKERISKAVHISFVFLLGLYLSRKVHKSQTLPDVYCSFLLVTSEQPYFHPCLSKFIYAFYNLMHKSRKMHQFHKTDSLLSIPSMHVLAQKEKRLTPFCNLSSTAATPNKISSFSIISVACSSNSSLSGPTVVFACINIEFHCSYSASSSTR